MWVMGKGAETITCYSLFGAYSIYIIILILCFIYNLSLKPVIVLMWINGAVVTFLFFLNCNYFNNSVFKLKKEKKKKTHFES